MVDSTNLLMHAPTSVGTDVSPVLNYFSVKVFTWKPTCNVIVLVPDPTRRVRVGYRD